MKHYLRIRAEDGRPVFEITDQGFDHGLANPDDLDLVLKTLSDHIRAFHQATEGSPSAMAAEIGRLKDLRVRSRDAIEAIVATHRGDSVDDDMDWESVDVLREDLR